MNAARYIKSFSKGQITIPKEIRDTLGMVNEFWLKLYIQDGKIIVEPIEQKQDIPNSSIDKNSYSNKLLKIKGDWFDSNEIARNRKQVEKQIKTRGV